MKVIETMTLMLVIGFVVVLVGYVALEKTKSQVVEFCENKTGVHYAGNGITLNCDTIYWSDKESE